MQEVSVSRTVDLPEERVREAMTDVERFMRAAGFDEVAVDGDTVTLHNSVGIATIELTLELVDGDYPLEYVQQEGLFDEMRTYYETTTTASGTEVRATTSFAVDVGLVGQLLDSTVVKRQRRKELNAQFDYLAGLDEE